METLEKAEGRTTPDAVVPAAVWQRAYARRLVLIDFGMLGIAGLIALLSRFGTETTSIGGISYVGVTLTLVLAWSTVLALSRCYEERFLGHGSEEYQLVGNASLRLAALVTFICFALAVRLSRVYVGVFLVVGFALLMLGRFLARRSLHAGRRRGEYVHRVLVVGSHPHVRALITKLRAEAAAGYVVVGACVPGARESRLPDGPGSDVPVIGSLGDIPDAVARIGADTVAVAASPGVNGEVLRSLSYRLEGSGVDLVVAPALTNVAGNRVTIRPIAGLPLLHVDEPEFTGSRKIVKEIFDRVVAAMSLLFLLPLLLALAIAVRVTSPGPAIFRQERVGRGGRLFTVWKFRSMRTDAETLRAELETHNESDGPLFKIRNDPRITGVGGFLRKYSLDELPQLVNVLRGDMSLVGPRPPLASEVEMYEGHTERRLLVKPGITGLWQVSGRSDLSWDETVRLDLHYVENWSLGLDITVLARTVTTVLRGSGAY